MQGLGQLKHVHIIGVCGTLMGAFAAYLKRSGLRVTGSDQNVYPPMSDVLAHAGVELITGYSADNIDQIGGPPDLVVIGNVISASNVEASEVIKRGLRYTSLPEALEKFVLPERHNIVICGTHGKTTTTSLMSFVLNRAGLRPGYFIGGVCQDLKYSFEIPQILDQSKKNYFVLEGDEYDTAYWDKVPKFFHYLPKDAILTSVEFDHADIYANLEEVVRAFEGLIKRIDKNGKLIACLDYPKIENLVEQAKARGVEVITYSTQAHKKADFKVLEIGSHDGKNTVKCEDPQKNQFSFEINLAGMHNAANALAVWIECLSLNLDQDLVKSAFMTFKGVRRRQEERGEPNGILVIDDFAHHPTAVRETLKALKIKYPKRKLIAVFEPRSATSRRKVFQSDYVQAFTNADEVIISAPFDQTKIPASDQFSSLQLVDDLIGKGTNAHLFNTVEEGIDKTYSLAKRGDLVAVLSNGGFGGFITKFIQKVSSTGSV